jgi:hypothetical protein
MAGLVDCLKAALRRDRMHAREEVVMSRRPMYGRLMPALALVLCAGRVGAQTEAPVLERTYTVTLGDMLGIALSEFLKLRPDLQDPAVVIYEKDAGAIDVEVFARPPSSASKADKAREVLGEHWAFIQATLLPYAERRWNVKLTADQFRLVYYDAGAEGGPKPILMFVKGQYVVQ